MGFNLTTEDYPHYTYKDYELWEGDWEIIRGIPYAMAPAPHWQHQSFGSNFIFNVREALKKAAASCPCRVLYESDWVVSEDTVVRPDVMIVCTEIEGPHVTTPPSLILEILSPSTVLKDRNTKFNLYQAYGVPYYLMADLGKKLLEVFALRDSKYQQLPPDINFQLTTSCSIQLSVANLFD